MHKREYNNSMKLITRVLLQSETGKSKKQIELLWTKEPNNVILAQKGLVLEMLVNDNMIPKHEHIGRFEDLVLKGEASEKIFKEEIFNELILGLKKKINRKVKI